MNLAVMLLGCMALALPVACSQTRTKQAERPTQSELLRAAALVEKDRCIRGLGPSLRQFYYIEKSYGNAGLPRKIGFDYKPLASGEDNRTVVLEPDHAPVQTDKRERMAFGIIDPRSWRFISFYCGDNSPMTSTRSQ